MHLRDWFRFSVFRNFGYHVTAASVHPKRIADGTVQINQPEDLNTFVKKKKTVEIDGDIKFVPDHDPKIRLSDMEDDSGISHPSRVMIEGGSGLGSGGRNVAFLMPEGNQAQQAGDAVAYFIIMDLHPPWIVEGGGFRMLMAEFRLPGEIPRQKKLENEIIPRLYKTCRESVAASLSCVDREFSLIIDEWKSNSDKNFATISICYQNMDEAFLEFKLLTTFEIPLEWGECEWGTTVDSLLLDWHLTVDRLTAVVVGTSRTALLAALSKRGLAWVPCLLHTLQICAQACFENLEVAAILSKCRNVIRAIGNHPAASAALVMQEQILQLEENAMKMDYPPVWTSTYHMLEQMALRRNIVPSLLEGVEENDQEIVSLSNEQWKIVEDLVTVLEPFKVTIKTLSAEKVPLISLLKPLLWPLVSSHLKAKDFDSEIVRSFKESLSDMLCDRYSDPSVTILLQTATILDPRFKQLPCATEEDKNMIAGVIKEMLTELIEEEGGEQNAGIEEELSSQQSQVSGLELLLEGLCVTKSGTSAEEKADLELRQYQSEVTAPLDYCPLQWWVNIALMSPNLDRLARRYNCVPACCAPPARIPAEKQVLYDKKRAALPPHLADMLLFLHSNHNVWKKNS